METVLGDTFGALKDAAPALAVGVALLALYLSSRQVRLSRQALEASHRPVVVAAEAPDRFQLGPNRQPKAEPNLDFEIRNIGKGPAINVRGQCAALLGGVAWGIGQTPHPVNVAADSDSVITFVADDQGQSLTLYSTLEARFAYEDLAGQTFWSTMTLTPSNQSYWCWIGRGRMPKELRLLESGPPPLPVEDE